MKFNVDIDADLKNAIRQFTNEIDPGSYKQSETQDSVVLEDGTLIRPVATFKTEKGCVAHIYIDNNRYVIGAEWEILVTPIRYVVPMTHSFPEAINVMKKLPDITSAAQEQHLDT